MGEEKKGRRVRLDSISTAALELLAEGLSQEEALRFIILDAAARRILGHGVRRLERRGLLPPTKGDVEQAGERAEDR